MKKYIKLSLFLAIFLSLPLFAKEELRSVTDMIGRKVLIPENIQKVVSLGGIPPINSFIFAIGEGKKIINGLPAFVKMPRFKYMLVFAPHLKNQPIMQTASRAPQIESILQAKPDVVFTFSRDDAKILSDKGIKTIVLIHWENAKDVAALMSLLGEIFHKEKAAKKYIEYFNKTIKKAQNLVKDIPIDKRPRVLYSVFSMFIQPVFIADWWIEKAGGVSVTKDRKQERLHFDAEQLIKWNPDVMVVTDIKSVKAAKQDPRFKNIKAVKNNKIYPVPKASHILAHLTSEQPLTVLWMLNKLYPQRYSEKELEKDVHYFYKEFFKTDLSKTQIKEILSGDPK